MSSIVITAMVESFHQFGKFKLSQKSERYPEASKSYQRLKINPDSLAIEPLQNQGVVGRVLTRHVGLKPDLRPNGLSGIKPIKIAYAKER